MPDLSWGDDFPDFAGCRTREDVNRRHAELAQHKREAIALGLPVSASPSTIAMIRQKRLHDATRPAAALVTKRAGPPAEPEPDLGDVAHAWSKNDLVRYVLQPLVSKIHEHVGTPLKARIVTLESENKMLKGAIAELQTKALRTDERAQRHAEHLGRLETKTQALRP